MYIITEDCKDFKICSTYVDEVFSNKSLKKINIKIEDCCNTIYDETLELDYPKESCFYSASYCNFKEQNTCEEKGSTNCDVNLLSNYYNILRELVFYIDGNRKNILDQSYNVETDNLQEYLTNYFLEYNTEVEVIKSYNESYLCLTLNFLNLPNGIKPEYFVLSNADTCYINSQFICEDKSTCVQWQSKFKVNAASYSVDRFTFSDGINEYVYYPVPGFSFTQIYVTTSAKDNEIQAFEDQVNGWLEFNNLNGTFSITKDTEHLIFTIEGVQGISYIINETGDPISTPIINIFECSKYEEPLPKCIYEAYVEDVRFVNTILAYQGNVASTPLFTNSLDLENLINVPNLEVIQEDNKYVFRFSNVDFIPDRIYFEKEGGFKEFAEFRCVDIDPVFNNPFEFKNSCIVIKDIVTHGVYKFTITTETEDTIITQTICKFVGCDLKCIIASLPDPTDVVNAYSLYETLSFIEDCGDCECDNACTLYEELINTINDSNDEYKQVQYCSSCTRKPTKKRLRNRVRRKCNTCSDGRSLEYGLPYSM